MRSILNFIISKQIRAWRWTVRQLKRWNCSWFAVWLLGHWDLSKSFFDGFISALLMFTMTTILKMSLMKRKRMGFMPYQNSRKSLLIERNTWKNSWKYFIKLDESQKNFGSSIKTIFCDYCFNKDICSCQIYILLYSISEKSYDGCCSRIFGPKKSFTITWC